MERITLDYGKPMRVLTMEEFKEEVEIDLEVLKGTSVLDRGSVYPNVEVKFHGGFGAYLISIDGQETQTIQYARDALKIILDNVTREDNKVVFRLSELMA